MICGAGIDPSLLPLQLFVMNEEEIGRYLYSNLQRPLKKNTDDFLITEFSTPKQLIRRQNVDRFLDLENLHGDIGSLLRILDNVKPGELRRLLDDKITEISEDQSGPAIQAIGGLVSPL